MFSLSILLLLILLVGGTLAWFYHTDRLTFLLYGRLLGLTLIRLAGVGAIVWGAAYVNAWWLNLLLVAGYAAWATAWAMGRARLKCDRHFLMAWGVATGAIVLGTTLVAPLLPEANPTVCLVVAMLLAITLRRMLGHSLTMLAVSLRHTKSHTNYLLANGATAAEALQPSLRRALRAAITRLFSAAWWMVMALLWICVGGTSAPQAALTVAAVIGAAAVTGLTATALISWIIGRRILIKNGLSHR